ncbi:hypothetical protein ACFLXQ_04695 [Chloroflexota bacterium]
MKKQIISTLAGLIVLCALGWYLDHIMRDEIVNLARLIIYAVSCLLLLTAIGILSVTGLAFRERLLKQRAIRKTTERKSKVMVVKADEGQQVFIRDSEQVTWRNAHLDTRVYANEQPTEPSQVEVRIWQTYQLRNRPSVIENVSPQLLPAQTPVDLLAALDTAQCALIVGPREVGKTTILQHVISRRLRSSQVLVLDPHSHPTRWPQGCLVVGTERDFPKIERALKGLMALMNKRYREIGKGLVREGEHSRVTVIIDEWRAIVYNLGKPAGEMIKTLLAESRKTNIDVFVGTHSERVKALGIEGEGDLKDGFVMVRLAINKMTKERKATIDYGEGEIPVILPGPFTDSIPSVVENDHFINLEVEPSPAEAHILNLHEAGESFNEIARQVYGNTGGKQTQRIKEVITRFS